MRNYCYMVIIYNKRKAVNFRWPLMKLFLFLLFFGDLLEFFAIVFPTRLIIEVNNDRCDNRNNDNAV